MYNRKKYILIILNIILIITAVASSLQYSRYLKRDEETKEKEAFTATVESMKQISANYLRIELGYASDWAKYISGRDMTVEEALDYIRATNNQDDDRYAHIVDMQTFEAHSTYRYSGDDTVTCYQKF